MKDQRWARRLDVFLYAHCTSQNNHLVRRVEDVMYDTSDTSAMSSPQRVDTVQKSLHAIDTQVQWCIYL